MFALMCLGCLLLGVMDVAIEGEGEKGRSDWGRSFDFGRGVAHPALGGWTYNPLPSLRTNGGRREMVVGWFGSWRCLR